MGSVLDAIQNLVSTVIDAIVDVVTLIWDEIVMPILEEIASLIGIDDETVINVKKVSIAIYEDNTEDVIAKAITKAVLEKKDSREAFFPIYIRKLLRNKAEIRSYHKYGDSGNYIHGLPQMSVKGQEADLVGIGVAVDADTGQANTILQVKTLSAPDPLRYFWNDLQFSHAYLPYNNTLTHLDPYAVSRSDWTLDAPIVFNIGPNDYSLPVSRLAANTKFWIDGPLQITEGDTAIYTIRANRTVPAGKTVTCNLTYSGTAVDAIDYTQVANVVMLANTSLITVSIVTLETGNANRNFTINLASITNTGAAFEEVTVVAPASVVTTITDDDTGLLLTMSDVLIGEGAGSATVVVKLEDTGGLYFEDFEAGPYTWVDFGGSVATVIANPQPTGNPSANVTKVEKSTGDINAFSKLTVTAPTFPTHERFTVLVYASRIVPVVLKLEQLAIEISQSHGGTGWETLTYDFTGLTTAIPANTELTFYFDKGVDGDFATTPADWTFYIDNIEQIWNAFSVDYDFTDVEATGIIGGGVGSDYDSTTGTLNFVGFVGETQNIVIPITSDVANDDYETFIVGLNNVSDISIIITREAVVTIVDGSADPIQDNILVQDIITKPNYTPESTLVAKYHKTTDAATIWFWWYYRFSTLVHPGLEMSSTTLTNLEMLPVAVLRKDKVMANVDKTSQLYLTTRVLMNRLGLPIDDFITSVGTNPDIGLIDDCYLNFAMGPNTNHKLISKMLYFTYFELIVVNGLQSNVDKFTALFVEGDINNGVVWTNHTVATDVVGTPTLEGDYLHTIVPTVDGSDLVLQWQKSATTYDEIIVSNLNGMSAVFYQTFHKMAVNKLGDDDFTIPISWFVFNQLSAKETMIVYQHICRVDVYAIQVTELAWYQTSAFANLFEFVSIVFSIITLGASSSFTELLRQLLLQYAIGELIVWVAEVTGNEELAALVGIVAQIYLSDVDFSFESLIEPDTLRELASQYAENFLLAKGTTMAIEIEEAELAALEEEEPPNPANESAIETEFLIYLQSVDTTMFPAIQGQYQFDSTVNYDSLIADFYNNNLRVGVV